MTLSPVRRRSAVQDGGVEKFTSFTYLCIDGKRLITEKTVPYRICGGKVIVYDDVLN